jgi:hypothetical protein
VPKVVVTAEDSVLDFSDLIDQLVAVQQAKIAKTPWKEAQYVRLLENRLDSLFSRFEKFEDKVLDNKAAKFKFGDYEFTAAKDAAITSLGITYGGFSITAPPDAQQLVDGDWTIGGSLTYNLTALREASTNDGAVSTQVRITLSGDKFSGVNGDALGEVINVPDGLEATLIRQTDTLAVLTLSGKATDHAAADTISNLIVEFSATDFFSGSIAGKANLIQNLSVTFYSLMLNENNNSLSISGPIEESLSVNLQTNKTLLGGFENQLQSGLMAAVTDVDLSGILVPEDGLDEAATITVIGDGQDNEVRAVGATGSYQMGSGNDTLILGSGIDTIIFEETPSSNGVDYIDGFRIGTGGDVLDFGEFLNNPQLDKLASVVNLDTGSGATTWANGDVLIMVGSGLSTSADIEAAFTGQFTTNARGKAVIITSDVIGDATVWYLVNQDDVTNISSTEITKVATLEDISNLAMSGYAFTSANFILQTV